MIKRIAWSAWQDPFLTNFDKFHHDPILEEELEENDNQEYSDDTVEKMVMKQTKISIARAIEKLNASGKKFFTSNLGIIPLLDNHYVSNNFNLWVGHTNFDITKRVVETIKQVPGVETLEVYTRYRFRVGFGMIFDSTEVKLEIERLLLDKNDYKKDLPEELKKKIEDIIGGLKKNYKYWGLCLLPNGETKIIHSKIKTTDFKQAMINLDKLSRAIGGITYSYQDNQP